MKNFFKFCLVLSQKSEKISITFTQYYNTTKLNNDQPGDKEGQKHRPHLYTPHLL